MAFYNGPQDRKKNAINLMMDNFQEQAEHHYMDANDFLADTAGKCYWHEGRCPLNVDNLWLDILFVSTSCKPFSMARTNRRVGTQGHDDINCIPSFI